MLRRAFDATLKDPAVLAEATKLGMEIKPGARRRRRGAGDAHDDTPDALAQRARDALKPPKQ